MQEMVGLAGAIGLGTRAGVDFKVLVLHKLKLSLDCVSSRTDACPAFVERFAVRFWPFTPRPEQHTSALACDANQTGLVWRVCGSAAPFSVTLHQPLQVIGVRISEGRLMAMTLKQCRNGRRAAQGVPVRAALAGSLRPPAAMDAYEAAARAMRFIPWFRSWAQCADAEII